MKKNQRLIGIIILCFIVALSCSCKEKPKQTKPQQSISLYFGNKEATDLVEEKMSVEGIEFVKIPQLVIERLLEGPEQSEHKRIIRAGTSLLDINLNKNSVTVNLSKEFYNEENILDVLASASIVKSLCSVSGVATVSILVEGTPLELDDGTIIADMKEGDLVFDADALTQDEANITLYFSDEDADSLVREIRRVKIPKGETMEKIILSELISGPGKDKTYRTLPQETKIRSVETTDGVCFVNLSQDFITKYLGGTASERLTVYSIVNSLTELTNVEKVQFLIEGEKKDVFIHMVFNEPIMRDVSMLE